MKCGIMWHYGVTSQHRAVMVLHDIIVCGTQRNFVMTPDVMWCHVMMSWHPLTVFRQEYWQRGHVAGGRVNAQVFFSVYLQSGALIFISDLPGVILLFAKTLSRSRNCYKKCPSCSLHEDHDSQTSELYRILLDVIAMWKHGWNNFHEGPVCS